MKLYDDVRYPRTCGDCTDMMMRSPVCAERVPALENGTNACDLARNVCSESGCGIADEYSELPLAIVSSPYQGFGDVFDCPMESLKHGTLFRTLYLPILDANGTRGRGGCNG